MHETYRVPEGDELVAFIATLPGAAFITASGWVEGVELEVPRGGAVEARAIPGRVTLLSLVGPKGGPLMAIVARADGDGVVGGRLVKARSAEVSIVALCAEATAKRDAAGHADRGAVAPSAAETKQASPPAPVATVPAKSEGAASAWAKVAALSHDDDDETDEAPKYGDRVHHFVFGLCDVMVIRGERMKIRDVHGPGRLREIHLSAVKVLAPIVEEGKRVFKLVRRS